MSGILDHIKATEIRAGGDGYDPSAFDLFMPTPAETKNWVVYILSEDGSRINLKEYREEFGLDATLNLVRTGRHVS